MWSERARQVVDELIDTGTAYRLTGVDLEKYVRAGYPFGARANWPYQTWLKAVRERFPRKKDRPEPLFDGLPIRG